MYTLIKRIVQKISDDGVTVYAAQTSFYIIISGIPFIYLLFIPLAMLISDRYGKIAEYIALFLPDTLNNITNAAVSEVAGNSNNKLLGFSAITLMWTASRGTQAVERGVRRVYGAQKRHGIVRNIAHSMFYTIVFIGIIIIALLVLVLGEEIITAISGVISDKVSVLRTVGAFLLLGFVFSLIYHSFSEKKDLVTQHIPGGAFASVGWMIFSKLFSVYTVYFSNHSYVYGSFAAVVLFMLWIYSCMIIFLLGAEVNVILKEWGLK